MVNLLGQTLPDRKLLKIALLQFYGVGPAVSSSILARLGLHDQLRVNALTEAQVNALSALLSAPASQPLGESQPTLPVPSSSSSSSSSAALAQQSQEADLPRPRVHARPDPIASLVIEQDLRRQIGANIAHHRTVGTLKGRQHAMGLPVRGQRNRTNAKTAKKLNRIERRAFSTASTSVAGATSRLPAASSPSTTFRPPMLMSAFRSIRPFLR